MHRELSTCGMIEVMKGDFEYYSGRKYKGFPTIDPRWYAYGLIFFSLAFGIKKVLELF